VFLDIARTFDNVIPDILIQELRETGFPAYFCKFIENLLAERLIFAVRNGDLIGLLITHKGTPQSCILSPLLFSFYLRNIGHCLHDDSRILQYADDIVLFSSNTKLSQARGSLFISLKAIYEFLRSLGLELAPHKSQSIIFTRRVRSEIQPFSVKGIQIPVVDSVKFLRITLDRRLSGALHLRLSEDTESRT